MPLPTNFPSCNACRHGNTSGRTFSRPILKSSVMRSNPSIWPTLSYNTNTHIHCTDCEVPTEVVSNITYCDMTQRKVREITAYVFILEMLSCAPKRKAQSHNRRQAIPDILHGTKFEETLISSDMPEYSFSIRYWHN